jgi:hypothetical protein
MNKNEHNGSSLGGSTEYGDFYSMAQGHCHADFEVTTLSLDEGNFIVITDLDKGNKSVTNDIDYVIRQLYHQADLSQTIDYSKILYRDSMKNYDGIKIKDGRFLSFYSIQEKEMKEAIKKAFKE